MEPEFEIINGRKVVHKHVAAIHCSGKLTLVERKISNVLLYKAFPTLSTQKIHVITLEELKRLLGTVTRNHDLLKKSLKTLISTVLEWNLCEDNLPSTLEGWSASSILSAITIKNGVVSYEYSETIRKLLSNPEIYGQVNLAIQSRFKSSYALALYENCSRFRKVGKTRVFDIDLFKELMGVAIDAYPQFDKLNKRVITQAVSEINTSSDIRIEPIYKKSGRKVIGIQFLIQDQKVMKRLAAQTNDYVDNQIKIDDDVLNQSIQVHGSSKVEKIIEYINKSEAYKKGEIQNITGYFIKLISLEHIDIPEISVRKKKVIIQDRQTIERKEWQEIFDEIASEIEYAKKMISMSIQTENSETSLHFQHLLNKKQYELEVHQKLKIVENSDIF